MSDLDNQTSVQGELAVGTVLDERYEIVAFIAAGGMCSVYKAEDRVLAKMVAIKLLQSRLSADADAVARFKREGIAIASLKHPNIIEVYGVGSWRQQPYISMEFLPGQSLAAVLRETGPISPPRAVNIFSQICDAIGHAHELGIIHRDVKPSNVMLFENDKVKLVDFGIAKILPDAGKDIQKLTQTGELFGTLAYMSPEQCMGQEVTRASDIFSLGCLMYEVLEGQPPFAGATAFETIHKRLTESPETTNRVGNLAPIILACLASVPDQRPLNTDVIKAALNNPASFRPNKREVKVAIKPRTRNTLLRAGVIIFGITAAVTGIVVSTTKVDETPQLLDFHIVGRTGETYMKQGNEQAAIPYLRRASDLARQYTQAHPAQDPRIQLELQLKLGRCLAKVGQYSEAASVIDDVLKRFPAHTRHDSTYYDALGAMGDICMSQQKPEAIVWRQRFLDYMKKTHDQQPTLDIGILRLAEAYSHVGSYKQAIPLLEPLLQRSRDLGNVEIYAAAITHLGNCYIKRSRDLGSGAEAQADYDKGTKLLRESLSFGDDPLAKPSADYAKTLLEGYSANEWDPKNRK